MAARESSNAQSQSNSNSNSNSNTTANGTSITRRLFGSLHGQQHPPRTGDTRSALTGLSLRSPGLRPTPEQDHLQEDLPDDIEFLSLDNDPAQFHPDSAEYKRSIRDDGDDDDDVDAEGEGHGLYDEDEEADGLLRDVDDEDDEDGTETANEDDDGDDMKDWPEEDGGAGASKDEAVHIEGVPRSDIRLQARAYKTPAFSQTLLTLLRDQLKVPGWAELPQSAQPKEMNVHKVSGSLTNAVFFISYPTHNAVAGPSAVPGEGTRTPPGGSLTDPHLPSTERTTVIKDNGSSSSEATLAPPTVLLRIYGPSSGNLISRQKELHVLNTLSAVYGIGPAILGTFTNGRTEEYFESRALYKEELRDPRTSRWIARRMRELHGVDIKLVELPPDKQPPHTPGTPAFSALGSSYSARGGSIPLEGLSRRSSEYAESYGAGAGAASPVHRPQAQPYQPHQASFSSLSSVTSASHHTLEPTSFTTSSQQSSQTSLPISTSSFNSVSSGGTGSGYSYSSSYSSTSSGGSASTSYLSSPILAAAGRRSSSRPGVSEGSAPRKKRSLSSIGSRIEFSLDGLAERHARAREHIHAHRQGSGGHGHGQRERRGMVTTMPRSVVWQNIESWSKEAKKVLKKVDKLDRRLGGAIEALAHKLKRTLRQYSESGAGAGGGGNDAVMEFWWKDINPLIAPSTLIEAKRRLDLPRFMREIRRYRRAIQRWEKESGKSRRVFAHNDTQCGNLLRLTPGGREEMVPGLRAPHEMIIVVDFEYAGVNPRGFDIANHFLEWQTDYHHPTLSHSVTQHGTYPTLLERQRFYRAYVRADGGFDAPTEEQEPFVPSLPNDDPRVQRLEEEVRLWTAASHAMYVVWSIVQATDDIVARIEGWINDPQLAQEAERHAEKLEAQLVRRKHTKASTETGRPTLTRGKSGEEIREAPLSGEGGLAGDSKEHANGEGEIAIPQIGDFDYISYALERVEAFRQELHKLAI